MQILPILLASASIFCSDASMQKHYSGSEFELYNKFYTAIYLNSCAEQSIEFNEGGGYSAYDEEMSARMWKIIESFKERKTSLTAENGSIGDNADYCVFENQREAGAIACNSRIIDPLIKKNFPELSNAVE